MSIEQIVNEAAALPTPQRKDLIGRLIALSRSETEVSEFRRRMAELIDDHDPSHWGTGDDLRHRLAADDAEK